MPTRSRSIVIVLGDLDVVVGLDGDGDVDRDAPSWTVRSSSSDCAAGQSRSAQSPWPDEVVNAGEELDGAWIRVKALEAQHATLSASAAQPLGTKRALVKVGRRSPRRRCSQRSRPRNVPRRQRRASCTEQPHWASTSSDSQLLAVHGQFLAVQRQACYAAPAACRRRRDARTVAMASLQDGLLSRSIACQVARQATANACWLRVRRGASTSCPPPLSLTKAALLRHRFQEDVFACPICHARLQSVAVLRQHDVNEQVLRRLALADPPQRAGPAGHHCVGRHRRVSVFRRATGTA